MFFRTCLTKSRLVHIRSAKELDILCPILDCFFLFKRSGFFSNLGHSDLKCRYGAMGECLTIHWLPCSCVFHLLVCMKNWVNPIAIPSRTILSKTDDLLRSMWRGGVHKCHFCESVNFYGNQLHDTQTPHALGHCTLSSLHAASPLHLITRTSQGKGDATGSHQLARNHSWGIGSYGESWFHSSLQTYPRRVTRKVFHTSQRWQEYISNK